MRGGHAGHGANLRIADSPVAEGAADLRQGRQSPGDPDFLAGDAEGQAALPVEPAGAGRKAETVTGAEAVEFFEQHQEAVFAGVEVGGQFGDAVGQLFDGQHRLGTGFECGVVHLGALLEYCSNIQYKRANVNRNMA